MIHPSHPPEGGGALAIENADGNQTMEMDVR